MKKLTFLLFFLIQTIGLLHADSGCMRRQGGLNNNAPKPVQCYCNCNNHKQVHGKCTGCNHYRVPDQIQIQQKK
ncbi:MAG: hypothetical protein ACXWL2_05195 [Candidatus Chromulinivorax sp.]